MNMQEWWEEKESETLCVKSGRQKSFKDVFFHKPSIEYLNAGQN